MKFKFNSVYQVLILITFLTFCISCSKDTPPPAGTDPALHRVDQNYVINGAIITITGQNFSANYDGVSQIIATNLADTSQVYLSILSRTSAQIVAVMTGSGGGTLGTYNLSYYSKPDTGAAKIYPGFLSVKVTAPATGQFSVSSTFTSNNVTSGTTASFGSKNGSTNAADYKIQLVSYDYSTGISTEYNAEVVSVTRNGFDGVMDLVSFTVPSVAAGEYKVEVTYNSVSTLAAGWNSTLIVN